MGLESKHKAMVLSVGAMLVAFTLMKACDSFKTSDTNKTEYKAKCIASGGSYLGDDRCIVVNCK